MYLAENAVSRNLLHIKKPSIQLLLWANHFSKKAGGYQNTFNFQISVEKILHPDGGATL